MWQASRLSQGKVNKAAHSHGINMRASLTTSKRRFDMAGYNMATDTEQIVDIRVRMAKLETQFDHIDAELKDMHQKVSDLHDLLMQAKGARWVVVGIAAIGGAGAAFIAKMIPFANTLPR